MWLNTSGFACSKSFIRLDSSFSGGRLGMTEGISSQLFKPFYSGNAQLSKQELLLAMAA